MKLKTYIRRNKKDLIVRPTKGKGRLIYEHTCNNCGKDFISNRRTAKYCSNSCRISWYKKNAKEFDGTL
jgi:uncharacterized OB-fold protein